MSFTPLGEDSDFPADPDGVRGYGEDLTATGALILEQVALLEALARGDAWVADTADAFREQAAELADRIEKSAGRYTAVGSALTTLADDLEDFERWAGQRAEEAQALQWTVLANPPATPEVPPEGGLPVLTEQGEAQNARRRRAEDRIEVLQGEFDGFVGRARDAASRAASAVKRAIDDDVKDNWWERNAGWLGKARTALGWIAAVAGIVIAVIGGILTAPVWLVALAVGAAVLALVVSIGLALEADGSWGDVAFDVLGVVTLGVGATLLKAGARAFPAVRGAVAGLRASAAQRAVVSGVPGHLLTELRRIASVADDVTGDAAAARTLLRELATDGRTAARAARDATLAPFPVTLPQRLLDGGLDASQMARQSREMLLDLRTMPTPVPPAVLQQARDVTRLLDGSIVAGLTGLAGELAQTPSVLTDPAGAGDSVVTVLVDVIGRLR